ncbi:MAG: hypothetical protein ABH883_06400, partial [Candidatus Omnitrophota bacterium]
TWDKECFSSKYSDESIEKLAAIGVQYVSICVTHYQEKYDSTEIISTDMTPSKKSLGHVIKQAHRSGLKVMLKPHIDLIDKYDGTYWRADIGFSIEEDWEKWFMSYEKMIVGYAKLAEKMKIALLCIGTELSFTTQKDDKWRHIISEVRKVYSGKIVYAANWDNFRNIKFWDELDYIGIDAYFPLTYETSPGVEDLKKGWQKWIDEINVLHGEIKKPVLFTEIGYPSAQHAPYTPWKNGECGNADPHIQAKCYKAFFETIWRQSWFAGVYWWKWDTNTRAGGRHNRQFTPQNKPAQRIIERHYLDYR